MSMDGFMEKAEAFYDAFAHREYDELRLLFLEMMKACALKCALEAAKNPTLGVGQWAGGRISICDELTNGVEDALLRAKGKANPEVSDGLALPPD